MNQIEASKLSILNLILDIEGRDLLVAFLPFDDLYFFISFLNWTCNIGT